MPRGLVTGVLQSGGLGARYRAFMRHLHTVVVLGSIAVLPAFAAAQDRIPFAPGSAPAPAFDPAVQISEYVRRVFQDRDGQFWFGTNGDGVCRYDGKSLTYLSVEQGFGGRAVRGIAQVGDGAMWFGTDGGVSRYDNGKFTNYTVANGLSDNEIWSLMRDKAGTIWVGTQEGVCRFDGKGFVAVHLPRVEVEHPASRFTPKVVFGMVQDQAGNIWFGTDGEGAHRYDGKTFTSYTTKEGLAGNQVRSIYGDRRGRIWLGTDGGGVSCYDGTTFKNYTAKDGLNNDRIFEILEDRAGNMWFSTLGAGACRYDGKSFTAFGAAQGLTRSHVQSMCEDRDGVLWFGCSGGLFRLEGERFVNVTRDGPWKAGAEKAAAGPLAGFARFTGGEWRGTFPGGTSAVHSWHWGPGKHSMRKMTDAPTSTWAGEVVYWHPGRKQVCVLSMHGDIPGVGRGSGDGTIKFEGEGTDGVFDLYQPRGLRKLAVRQVFEGLDKYHEVLLEDGGAGFKPLAEWDFVRVKERTVERPRPAAPVTPLEHMKAFEALLGGWEAEGVGSTLEWVPSLEMVYARAVSVGGEHLLDAYFYRHVKTNTLRCLALSNAGGVYEGDVRVIEGGALEMDFKGYEGERVLPRMVRVEFEKDGAVRGRVWGGEGALVLDGRYKKVAPRDAE